MSFRYRGSCPPWPIAVCPVKACNLLFVLHNSLLRFHCAICLQAIRLFLKSPVSMVRFPLSGL